MNHHEAFTIQPFTIDHSRISLTKNGCRLAAILEIKEDIIV